MAVVTTLPRPPSRINSPHTFVVDASLFLDRLNTFQQEVNTFSTTLTTLAFNMWNMGGITNSLPSLPVPESYTKPSGVGLPFIYTADALYAAVHNNVNYYNSVDSWLQQAKKEIGVAGNRESINIPLLTAPQKRDEQPLEFNTNAINFTQSNIDNTNAMSSFMSNVLTSISEGIDCGSVSDGELDRFIDCGWVTDKVIANDEVVDFYHLTNFKLNKLQAQIITTTTEVLN